MLLYEEFLMKDLTFFYNQTFKDDHLFYTQS